MADASKSDWQNEAKTSDADEAKRDVKENYESLRSDVSGLATAVRDLAGSEVGDAVNKAQHGAEKGLEELESKIRANPTQAAAIAAGVGFLVGLIVTR